MTAGEPALSFLRGGGRLGELIAAFDWSGTALGPIDGWPPHVRTATALMLRSVVPIVMLWGEPGVMIYNDAYSLFAGGRHPRLLGTNVREAWDEVADFNDNVMRVGLAGGTLSYSDQELTLNRNGRAEPVWMNLDYSPLLDEAGQPAGVMAVVVETTAKVLAERRLSGERERLAQLFEQAPGFMAMLRGPEHRFELVNPSYLRLVGSRPLLGRSVAEALPEAASQGYVSLLDGVYESGQAYSALGARFDVQLAADAAAAIRHVDFVFQPIRDETGTVSGVFIEGADVTGRVAAERRREAMVQLADSFRDRDDPGEVAFVAARLLGEALAVSRVGYGTIDPEAETLHVRSDWNAPGVETLAGVLRLRDYGSFIESLKVNEFIAIADVRDDPRTAAAAPALEARSARSFVNVPVVEQGRLVAVLYVNHAERRDWSEDDLALVREVAERTRTAVERARGALALRESEARLREANESLEAKVEARTRELLEVEAKFRQAQKMEAIGQLTGGIAHDFNNILTVITGTIEILADAVKGEPQLAAITRMIDEAASRGADLTQHLLAFARKQPLEPKETDVNTLIIDTAKLLQRTLGEHVEIESVFEDEACPAIVDPNQLATAILNLALNARDAMPDGGKLIIETCSVVLDENYARMHGDVRPGRYAMIAVSDTGSGIPADMLDKVFNPFFTSKGPGKGTGLGLSMVYGFVKQSAGHIMIYSEQGHGTTIKMYLPPATGTLPATEPTLAPKVEGGHETILVVEDDKLVRDYVLTQLHSLGYVTLDAANATEALAMVQAGRSFDLLFTDVIMPGLNGRQLANEMLKDRPGLRVLFTSGYTENAIIHHGRLDEGVLLLAKPYRKSDMAIMIRKALAD